MHTVSVKQFGNCKKHYRQDRIYMHGCQISMDEAYFDKMLPNTLMVHRELLYIIGIRSDSSRPSVCIERHLQQSFEITEM